MTGHWLAGCVHTAVLLCQPTAVSCVQLVVEPSGATGLAGALSDQFKGRHEGLRRVGVILCGGNIDLAALGTWDRVLNQKLD